MHGPFRLSLNVNDRMSLGDYTFICNYAYFHSLLLMQSEGKFENYPEKILKRMWNKMCVALLLRVA